MRCVQLHGARDLRVGTLPNIPAPGPGEILLRSKAVGICGSDLHSYADGRIGSTAVKAPLVLGHEFAGIVEAVGPGSFDGTFKHLAPGAHVAVDPCQPCEHCEMCERGDPNLCLHHKFLGLFPDDGALRTHMLVPARTCFPIDPAMDFGEASLLETLGVAIHAVDLSKIRVGDSCAILGAGPIGLCILQIARLAGAAPIFVTDLLPWRLALAEKLGAVPVLAKDHDPVASIMQQTKGRGVDVVIEAAWADATVNQAIDMARYGGRVTLVGIPGDDRCEFKHSTARRKGLTLRMARRMKLVYPRAIELHRRGLVDLKSLISHRFPLEKTAEAFAINARYEPGVMKVIIEL